MPRTEIAGEPSGARSTDGRSAVLLVPISVLLPVAFRREPRYGAWVGVAWARGVTCGSSWRTRRGPRVSRQGA
jgi:hypothetical protein